jgi:hypothetical protein
MTSIQSIMLGLLGTNKWDCFDYMIPLDGCFMEMDRSNAFHTVLHSNEKRID